MLFSTVDVVDRSGEEDAVENEMMGCLLRKRHNPDSWLDDGVYEVANFQFAIMEIMMAVRLAATLVILILCQSSSCSPKEYEYDIRS